MSDWHNKAVLITGGSAGLGLAIARAFQSRGAAVAIAGRDRERLDRAAADLATPGKPCAAFSADITRDDDAARLIEETVARLGRLDVLVNCAGRSDRGEAAATKPAVFAEMLEINFLAAVRCTRLALPHLRSRGDATGHLVFIGSLASKIASRYLGAYPASKFPLAAYAQQLRLELGESGPHVLLVCPGPLRRPDSGRRYDSEARGLPPQARLPGGGAPLKGIEPEWLARRILRACERRERELIVPSYVRWLVAIQAISPAWGDWILRRATR